MMPVRLTAAEMEFAASEGLRRQLDAIAKGRHNQAGWTARDEWQRHIEGALGEFAFAKGFGLPWSGKEAFGAKDVAGMQVRTSAYATACLPIKVKDNPDDIFWLVTGCDADYVIRGCIRGRDVRSEWFGTKGEGKQSPAYWVPQHALHWPTRWVARHTVGADPIVAAAWVQS